MSNNGTITDYPNEIEGGEGFEYEDCEVDDWTCPNCSHQSPIRTFDILDRQQKKIEELEKELHQQRFNNKHNLSIDQTVADKIKELEAREKKLIECLELAAHTGVDCGYGKYTAKMATELARKTLKEIEVIKTHTH